MMGFAFPVTAFQTFFSEKSWATLRFNIFFYPFIYQGDENNTQAFATTVKANNAKSTQFNTNLSTLAMFLSNLVLSKCIAMQHFG